MRTNTLKSLTIALLACTLFASCNKEKIIVDKDTLIQEMIDTLLFHQERQEGDAMLSALDSLKNSCQPLPIQARKPLTFQEINFIVFPPY